MDMCKTIRLLTVVALLATACSFASAEHISYLRTDDGGTDAHSYNFDDNSQTHTVLIPQFNIDGATLNSVTVTIWDVGDGTIIVRNTSTSGGAAIFDAYITRRYNVEVPGADTFNAVYAPADTVSFSLAPGESDQADLEFSHNSAEQYIVNGRDIMDAYYTGSDDVSFVLSSPYNGFRYGYEADGGATGSTEVTDPDTLVGVEVVYNYTMDPPVPEPASLALLPMVLGGLMMWRRRRTA